MPKDRSLNRLTCSPVYYHYPMAIPFPCYKPQIVWRYYNCLVTVTVLQQTPLCQICFNLRTVHEDSPYTNISLSQLISNPSNDILLYGTLPLTCISCSNFRSCASVLNWALKSRSWYCLFSIFCKIFSSRKSAFLEQGAWWSFLFHCFIFKTLDISKEINRSFFHFLYFS